MKKLTEEQWNDINEGIRYDGYGRATGLRYDPFMRCDNCGEMTSRDEMVWVRIRTYDGGTREGWCTTCEARSY